MNLYFNQMSLPRTMTRQEWREIDRWRRVTQRELQKETQRQITHLACYGSTMHPSICSDLVDRLTRPPMLMGTPL